MSPSAYITPRKTKSGPRYVVRYRTGGRFTPLVHAGSFKTMRDARSRRDLVVAELAAGRDPQVALRALSAPAVVPRTAGQYADDWLASRIDLAESTRQRTYRNAVAWFTQFFGDVPIESITSADLQEEVTQSELAATSLQTYMAAVKQVFDYAGVDPNPARGRRVRLPRMERTRINPPPLVHVEAIVANARAELRLPIRLLAETGVRVGELQAWTWGDVDIAGSQILVPRGKTKAARRWVQIEPERMLELLDTCPPDDRGIDRRLFDLGESSLRGAIRRACLSAGIPHYSPHDFRHRHISVLLKRGLSRAEVASLVGHSNTNELATYEHVVLEDA